MPFVNEGERWIALSTCKQPAYGQALSDTADWATHPVDSGMFETNTGKRNDKAQAGKGHLFATRQENTTSDTKAPISCDGSSYLVGLLASLANGQVVTSQPAPVTPGVFKHVFTMMDFSNPSVGKQLPSTTFIENITGGEQFKYRDMVCKSFKITGKSDEQIKVSADFVGSGHYELSSIEKPSLVQGTGFLNTNTMTFQYNGVMYSPLVKEFTFEQINELAEKDGYCPQSGFLNATPGAPQIKKRCLITGFDVTLSLKLLFDTNVFKDDMLNNVKRDIVITAEAEVIEGTHKHQMLLELSDVWLEEVKRSSQDKLLCVDIKTTLGYNETWKSPYRLTVINTVPEYLGEI